MYLKDRQPIVLNYNPFITFFELNDNKTNFLKKNNYDIENNIHNKNKQKITKCV